MHTRTLGPQGPAVSAIGLGCMTTTGGYGATPDRAEMLAHVRSAVDLGVTFFDTAEIYGPHANEELVGEALRDVLADRDDVVIATKFAQHVDPATRTATGRMLRPDEVAAAADGSLQRLGVEAIDLYYQHRVNPEFPIEEFAGAVADLVAAGKVKHYGLSEAAADTIRRAHAVHPVTAVQSEYSLWWRRPEEAVLGVCAELGVGFVPFSPLGKGFLTGTIATGTSFAEGSDLRASIPRFAAAAQQQNAAVVDLVRRFAERKGCTPGQIALAWLLARQPWIVPIPGTTNPGRLRENVAAAEVTLTPEEVEELSRQSAALEIEGGRYPDWLEAQTNL
ncbi:aldo/keto reductase [Kineococcus sp. NBC_00420]|uniref:aldo/keto reductase n=1 Tax=Kineococcus sp. NBC_00420 TaxID=2903564 RepID=UPI002E1F5102